MNIGNFIKQLRTPKNLSVNQLSLYSGVSSSHISRIERGLKKPSPEILKKISAVLKVPYEEFLKVSGYIDNPQNNISNNLYKDISSLSPESQKEVKKYIELLKIRDMQERNRERNNR